MTHIHIVSPHFLFFNYFHYFQKNIFRVGRGSKPKPVTSWGLGGERARVQSPSPLSLLWASAAACALTNHVVRSCEVQARDDGCHIVRWCLVFELGLHAVARLGTEQPRSTKICPPEAWPIRNVMRAECGARDRTQGHGDRQRY